MKADTPTIMPRVAKEAARPVPIFVAVQYCVIAIVRYTFDEDRTDDGRAEADFVMLKRRGGWHL